MRNLDDIKNRLDALGQDITAAEQPLFCMLNHVKLPWFFKLMYAPGSETIF